jgi:hypothetical protein
VSDVPNDDLPAGLPLELDLSNVPKSRAAIDNVPAPPSELSDAAADLLAVPLELEDISPPPGASAARAAKAAQVVPEWTPPALSQPSEPLPVRTLELRIAQAVDRMSPLARVSLLMFSVAAMLLFATAMLIAGTRKALNTMESLVRSAPAAVPQPGSAGAGAGARPDPYEAYRVDHLVDVDDEGRHRPPR